MKIKVEGIKSLKDIETLWIKVKILIMNKAKKKMKIPNITQNLKERMMIVDMKIILKCILGIKVIITTIGIENIETRAIVRIEFLTTKDPLIIIILKMINLHLRVTARTLKNTLKVSNLKMILMTNNLMTIIVEIDTGVAALVNRLVPLDNEKERKLLKLTHKAIENSKSTFTCMETNTLDKGKKSSLLKTILYRGKCFNNNSSSYKWLLSILNNKCYYSSN